MTTLTWPIRVPADLLEELGEHAGIFWSDSLGMEPVICDAIRAWIKPAPAVPASQPQVVAPSDAGYQWKEVFLPEGTRLRACFDGTSYFAQVEGAEIKYDGYAISPSAFANLQGSGNRNAWKTIWLRLPGSEGWLFADVLRTARKVAIGRMLGSTVDIVDPSVRAQPFRAAHQLRRDWTGQPAKQMPSRQKRAGGIN